MEEVYNQLFCLLAFSITGIAIGILFDIFRILRRSFKTTDLITYIEDILFWILTGAIVLFSIFKFNDGQIRSYVVIGIAFGIFIYMFTISKFIIKYSVIIIKWIKKIISYPINIIINIIKNIIIKPILSILKKLKNIIIIIEKKRTKKPKKLHKKQINLKEKEGIL